MINKMVPCSCGAFNIPCSCPLEIFFLKKLIQNKFRFLNTCTLMYVSKSCKENCARFKAGECQSHCARIGKKMFCVITYFPIGDRHTWLTCVLLATSNLNCGPHALWIPCSVRFLLQELPADLNGDFNGMQDYHVKVVPGSDCSMGILPKSSKCLGGNVIDGERR